MRVPTLCILLAWVSAFGQQPDETIAGRCGAEMIFLEAAVTNGPGGEPIRGFRVPIYNSMTTVER